MRRPAAWLVLVALVAAVLPAAGWLGVAAVTAPPAAAAMRPSLLAIGDSTLRGMAMSSTAQAVLRAGSYDVDVDAYTCRRLITTSCKHSGYALAPNALTVLRSKPGRTVLVIMTGYNDWTVGAAVDAIMAEAGRQGVSDVVWLTYRTDIVEGAQKPIAISEIFRQHNAELRAKQPQWPRLTVADWDGYSAGHDSWFAWDGFHLSLDGAVALAWYLRSIIDGFRLDRCLPDAPTGTPAALGTPAPATAPAGLFTPATPPVRLLDTRAADGDAETHPLGGGRAYRLPLVASGRVPPGTTSAMLNLTATNTCAAGFLTAYPCSAAVPVASNANYGRRRTSAALASVLLSPEGDACVYSSAQVDLVVDLFGWFGPSGDGFHRPAAPFRLLDTRPGTVALLTAKGALAPGETRSVSVAGLGGVAGDARAALVNLTMVAVAPGHVTADGCATRASVSNVNSPGGVPVANLAVVPLDPAGSLCLTSSAGTHVVVDVVGWFSPDPEPGDERGLAAGAVEPGARFVAATPARVLDTRLTPGGRLAAGGEVGLPTGAVGRLATVTAVAPEGPGYLTVGGCGPDRPWVSTLNFVTGQAVPNLAVLPAAATGEPVACVSSRVGTDVLVDVAGEFVAPGAADAVLVRALRGLAVRQGSGPVRVRAALAAPGPAALGR